MLQKRRRHGSNGYLFGIRLVDVEFELYRLALYDRAIDLRRAFSRMRLFDRPAKRSLRVRRENVPWLGLLSRRLDLLRKGCLVLLELFCSRFFPRVRNSASCRRPQLVVLVHLGQEFPEPGLLPVRALLLDRFALRQAVEFRRADQSSRRSQGKRGCRCTPPQASSTRAAVSSTASLNACFTVFFTACLSVSLVSSSAITSWPFSLTALFTARLMVSPSGSSFFSSCIFFAGFSWPSSANFPLSSLSLFVAQSLSKVSTSFAITFFSFTISPNSRRESN